MVGTVGRPCIDEPSKSEACGVWTPLGGEAEGCVGMLSARASCVCWRCGFACCGALLPHLCALCTWIDPLVGVADGEAVVGA